MRVVGIIPSRYDSKRFPGKPLAKILGKPMIEWVIKGALESKLLSDVILATDNEEIAKVGDTLGIKKVLTPSAIPTGTDRVWEVAKDLRPEIIVNIQGDEPMVTGNLIDSVVNALISDQRADISTPVYLDYTSTDDFNRVKVVVDLDDYALYFSRESIPHFHESHQRKYLIHIGIYAYRFSALERFVSTPPTPLELAENLEQLRALQLGLKIKIVHHDRPVVPVDTPEDLSVVERLLLTINS